MGWEVARRTFTDMLLRLDRDYDLPPGSLPNMVPA